MHGAGNSLAGLIKSLLPVEWVMLAGLIILCAGRMLLHLPLLPAGMSDFILFLLYFLPGYAACMFIRSRCSENLRMARLQVCRTYLSFLIACYLCIDFKHWSHILHYPHYFDGLYQQWDNRLAPVIHAERRLNDWLGIPVSIENYLLVFWLVFCLAFPLCYSAGSALFMALAAAYAVNLVVGGLSYCIAPALGPFMHWPIEQRWHPLLHHFMEATTLFTRSGGAEYRPRDFAYILGAMPSQHVSIPLICSWYMLKANRLAGLLGILATVFSFMHAQFTGLHYFADVVAGFFLGILSIVLADMLTRRYQSVNAPEHN